MAKSKGKSQGISDAQVIAFCKAMAQGLNKEYWGSIEPATFENIGEGMLTVKDCESRPDDLLYDKISDDEMADSVASLAGIVRAALGEVL